MSLSLPICRPLGITDDRSWSTRTCDDIIWSIQLCSGPRGPSWKIPKLDNTLEGHAKEPKNPIWLHKSSIQMAPSQYAIPMISWNEQKYVKSFPTRDKNKNWANCSKSSSSSKRMRVLYHTTGSKFDYSMEQWSLRGRVKCPSLQRLTMLVSFVTTTSCQTI
jgi:hypothetical protein